MSDVQRSADLRQQEAQVLYEAGMFAAAIYLNGYAAEMLLKYAYFRWTGASLDASIPDRLGPAVTRARGLIPGIPDENCHSLRSWFRLIAESRRAAGCPLAQSSELSFMRHILTLHGGWWVGMRYRPESASRGEASDALESAEWLRRFSSILWR